MVPERAKVILVLVGSAVLVAVALVIVPGRPDQPLVMVRPNISPVPIEPLVSTELQVTSVTTTSGMPESANSVTTTR